MFRSLLLYCSISETFLGAVGQQLAVTRVLLPAVQWMTLGIFVNERGDYKAIEQIW